MTALSDADRMFFEQKFSTLYTEIAEGRKELHAHVVDDTQVQQELRDAITGIGRSLADHVAWHRDGRRQRVAIVLAIVAAVAGPLVIHVVHMLSNHR